MIETRVETFVRNCWYVAAWVSEIPQDGLFHRTLLNESVLIYRKSSGGLTAMENRCCHRGAPMHHGRREGDDIRCGYHGMLFGCDGICTEVPGQERVPAKASIRTYPVVEKDEFVWIWMGDPALADPDKILSYWWHNDHENWPKRTATLHYEAPYTLIVDNLLDFSHLSYVHENTIGTPMVAKTRANIEAIEGGVKVTRWYLGDQIQASRASIATFTGPADRWQRYEWHAPSFLHLYTGTAPADTGAPEGIFAPETMEYKHCSVQTPETEDTTFYFFSHAAGFNQHDPNVIDTVFAGLHRAFIEDKVIIEAQQAALKLGRPFEPMTIVHDAALIKARSIIDQLIAAETAAEKPA